jgi:hypothetical protein
LGGLGGYPYEAPDEFFEETVANRRAPHLVKQRIAVVLSGGMMSFLKKLFGGKSSETKQRVRVCVECGMPVDQHRDWCGIFRTQQELDRKAATRAAADASS